VVAVAMAVVVTAAVAAVAVTAAATAVRGRDNFRVARSQSASINSVAGLFSMFRDQAGKRVLRFLNDNIMNRRG
jgi:hypothetical protein